MSHSTWDHLPWSEVSKIHRTSGGIALRKGVAHSLLCSDHPDSRYRDVISGDEITYHFSNAFPTRSGVVHFQTIGRGLAAAMSAASPIVVFRKNAINDWSRLGDYLIQRIEELGEDSIAIHLKRCEDRP